MAEKRDDVRRTTRIIKIDEMLRGGNFVSMDDLIFEFGVSQRTIERDFERLRDEMQAPLVYDKTLNKYHYSDPTYSIPNVVLTEGDLFTVSTVLPLMEQYENTPLENSFRHIMSKITDMLPDTITVDSSFLNKDITFLKDAAPLVAEDVFNNIFKAIKSRKTITFDYKSISSQIYKQKTFDAYHVLCQKGNWYVIGYDHGAADIRVYAMSRIKEITFTQELFKIPADFKLENHVDLDFGIWNNTEPPEEYELLFTPAMANYITERQWHKDQKMEIQKDGSVLLSFKSNQKEMISSWIMGFGPKVTVKKPESLIKKIKE
ncbi:MAG: WYL domain-containing transcriptional regulator, partial [Treponema sp.]|nr:WYL domain-containing transcriptional regulator [Treponema sp.]